MMDRRFWGLALTWGLAVLFLVVIDAAVTRTRVLWGPTTFENTRDMERVMFAQTYRAARMIYAPRRAPEVSVAILGNSRIWIPAREAYLRREAERIGSGLDVGFDNLAVFGARLGDVEVLSRHLGRLDPTLVVLALGGMDLVARPAAPLYSEVARLMRIGWRDGPLPPSGIAERVDRWARTAWPLYRFREFSRAALEDRISPGVDAGPFPERFENTRELFEYMHGDRGAEVERGYRAWRAEPSLESFVAYLQRGSGGYLEMVRERVHEGVKPAPEGTVRRVLEAVLRRVGSGPGKAVVLLMPENPILSEDVAGRYHWPGFSDDAAEMIRGVARRCKVPVIDGRRWMPAEAFIDFDHLLPDLSGFQEPLVREILGAIYS